MKMFNSIQALVLSLLLACASSALAQQSETVDRDLALGIPQAMTVDAVDIRTGLLVLDGQRYRYADSVGGQLAVMSAEADRGLSLEQLRPGMQVMVQTDGTQASRGTEPLVLRLWRAQ